LSEAPIAEEQAVQDLFEVCNGLYNFFRKPTIASQYKGEKLKRLLGHRWTGHLATTSTVLNSFQTIVALLNQISSTRSNGAEIRMQATGLLREISEQSFLFLTKLIYKVSA